MTPMRREQQPGKFEEMPADAIVFAADGCQHRGRPHSQRNGQARGVHGPGPASASLRLIDQLSKAQAASSRPLAVVLGASGARLRLSREASGKAVAETGQSRSHNRDFGRQSGRGGRRRCSGSTSEDALRAGDMMLGKIVTTRHHQPSDHSGTPGPAPTSRTAAGRRHIGTRRIQDIDSRRRGGRRARSPLPEARR